MRNKTKSKPIPFELFINMSQWLEELHRESINKQVKSEIDASKIYLTS